MKKRMFAAVMAVLMTGTLTACSNNDKPAQKASAEENAEENSQAKKEAGSEKNQPTEKSVTLKFAHTVPSGTATADCIQRFCDEVTKESSGKLTIECYPDSQLGDDDEICDQIYNGAQMLDYVDPAKMEDYYADYSILVTPYFFESADEIKEFAWSELGQELSDGCAAAGMKCLDNMGGYYGARDIMSMEKITKPEDMKKMKFRVPSTTMWVAMANAWGTNATTVAFSEAYTALSQGVIDSIENPVPSMLSASFQEVCKYLNLTHHMYAANGIVMNNGVFEGLDTDMQDLLINKAKEFDEWTFEEISTEEQSAVKKMEEAGVAVNDQVDLDAFQAASESIYETYSGWSEDLVERCKATLNQIRGK